MPRRHFLQHALAGAASLATSFAATPSSQPAASAPPRGTEPDRGPQLDAALVREFVGASHANLPRVKELFAAHPTVINASYDWGRGDWETGLGAASHVGNRPMALLLLESGARIDAFSATMLGEVDILTRLLRLSPAIASIRGPHNYSLLYHAAYSGKIALAEAIASHLTHRAADCNQALHSATVRGDTAFVAWLLENGVDNPNTQNFARQTPLDVALKKNRADLAHLLRAHGATSAP